MTSEEAIKNCCSKEQIQKSRIAYAILELADIGIDVHYEDETCIKFYYKGSECTMFPHKGWFTGKTIKDGRGIKKLINQLKST